MKARLALRGKRKSGARLSASFASELTNHPRLAPASPLTPSSSAEAKPERRHGKSPRAGSSLLNVFHPSITMTAEPIFSTYTGRRLLRIVVKH